MGRLINIVDFGESLDKSYSPTLPMKYEAVKIEIQICCWIERKYQSEKKDKYECSEHKNSWNNVV